MPREKKWESDAERMAAKRAAEKHEARKQELREMGLRGEPSPYQNCDWSKVTKLDLELNQAWADGVWERQGMVEDLRRERATPQPKK